MFTNPPEIIFLGIEPESLDASMELSPLIEKNIPVLVNLVMKEIELASSQNEQLS